MKHLFSIESPAPLSRKGRLVGFSIIGICLIFTFLLWTTFSYTNDKAAQQRMNADTDAVIDVLEDRLEVSTDVLYSGRGIFLAQPNLSRTQWDVFVDTQNIFERYSSLRNLLYAKVGTKAQAADIEAFINASRVAGEPEVKIRPAELTDRLAVVAYLAQKTQVQIVGANFEAMKTFADAMNRADLTASPTATEPYPSPIPDRKGTMDILLLLSIYDGTYRPENSDEAKRAAVTGYIAASMNVKTLFEYALLTLPNQQQIHTTVTDHKGTILYDAGDMPEGMKFVRDVNIDVGGQKWTLSFTAPRDYDLTGREKAAPTFFLISGVVLMLFLVSLYYFRQGIRIKINRSKKQQKK